MDYLVLALANAELFVPEQAIVVKTNVNSDRTARLSKTRQDQQEYPRGIECLGSSLPSIHAYIAGALEAGTRDHVPPKCLFPRPRPVDTVTVPACMSCNSSYQMDDLYFAVMMAMRGYDEHAGATRVWQCIIQPLLARSPAFRRMLQQNMIDAPVRTPAGIVLPGRRAVAFSQVRIDRIVRRIVRGLLWHHHRQRPAADAVLDVFQQQIIPRRLLILSMRLLAFHGLGVPSFVIVTLLRMARQTVRSGHFKSMRRLNSLLLCRVTVYVRAWRADFWLSHE